jgi:FtsZ-binding cell division protein ZapB
MKQIKITAIRIDGGTQARLQLDQAVVKEYSEHMKDGDKFPPIVVFHDGSEHWLADGFHRYFASKSNGALDIECDVREGTLDDALLYAFSANGRRGLSMSAEDNRSIITRMLQHPVWGKWSNAEIAKHVGVSKMTVGRVKASLEKDQEKPAPTKKKYTDKHGNESTIETKNLGKKKVKPEPEPEPEPEPDNDVVRELTDTINSLSQENTILKDQIAIGQWDATDIEKIDIQETVTELRKQIHVLEIENRTLRDSRDMYQNRNAELMGTVKSLQSKLKKLNP